MGESILGRENNSYVCLVCPEELPGGLCSCRKGATGARLHRDSEATSSSLRGDGGQDRDWSRDTSHGVCLECTDWRGKERSREPDAELSMVGVQLAPPRGQPRRRCEVLGFQTYLKDLTNRIC